tara:strand:+ start:2320 stop:2901 length:582 start_codon:yes stop_codon:yes gene_type:complete
MSTRATYQIFDDTFYIHHDGYLEGAAMYFFNMVQASRHIRNGIWDWSKPKGGAPFAFIRGNANCEPTTGHDAHGDTEYKYTLFKENDVLKLIALERTGWATESWHGVFCGSLCDFVNKYYNHPVNQIVDVNDKYSNYLCTREQALKAAEGYLEQSNKFNDDNPNKIGYLNTVKALNTALDNLKLEQELSTLNA